MKLPRRVGMGWVAGLFMVLVLLSSAVAPSPVGAAGRWCVQGQGFGYRDGHNFVYFQANFSANHWEVTEPWYIPNANLWNPPSQNGYAEAGFHWQIGVPKPFRASQYQLCGWS